MSHPNDADHVRDKRLISEYYDCSIEAFQQLHERWFEKLLLFFQYKRKKFHCTCANRDVEDLATATLLKVANSKFSSSARLDEDTTEAQLKPPRRYDPEQSRFSTWITRLAHNELIEHVRKEHPAEKWSFYATIKYTGDTAADIPISAPLTLELRRNDKAFARNIECPDSTLAGLAAELISNDLTSEAEVSLVHGKINNCVHWWIKIECIAKDDLRLLDNTDTDLLVRDEKPRWRVTGKEVTLSLDDSDWPVDPPARKSDESSLDYELAKQVFFAAVDEILLNRPAASLKEKKRLQLEERIFHRRTCSRHDPTSEKLERPKRSTIEEIAACKGVAVGTVANCLERTTEAIGRAVMDRLPSGVSSEVIHRMLIEGVFEEYWASRCEARSGGKDVKQ